MTTLGIGPEARRRLSARRIAEIVADELRRQIIDGELADGDLLPRQEVLVEQFNVSLVSLREALRILETEGLVSVRRGNRGGAVVHAPAKTSAAYMLGLLLQSESVRSPIWAWRCRNSSRRAPHWPPGGPTGRTPWFPKLKQINDSMAEHLEDGARSPKSAANSMISSSAAAATTPSLRWSAAWRRCGPATNISGPTRARPAAPIPRWQAPRSA